MNDLSVTPQAARALAEAKLKQRDDAIRANGIREGRKLERAEMLAQAGAQTLEEAGLLATVRQEQERAMGELKAAFARMERKHGLFRLWQGIALGASLGAIAAGSATYVVIDGGQKAAFDAATEAAARNVVTGYALQRSREPVPPPGTEK